MWRNAVENTEEIVQLRTSSYLQQPEVRTEQSPVDLERRLNGYIRLNQGCWTSKALRATGVTVEALAEAIRETCRFADLSQQESLGLENWSSETKKWYLNEWKADKTERKELRTYEDNGRTVQVITMTVLGIPAFFTRQQEKLCALFQAQGLIVDRLQDQSSITWKAPLKPDLASSEEIPAVISFVHNEEAEKFWWGLETFEIARRKIKAVNPAAIPDHSFKMRPMKAKKEKAGILAEISHLLRMNGMSTGQISEIYRQACLQQGVALMDLCPHAGMFINVQPKKRNLSSKNVFAAVGVDAVVQQREIDWIARCSSAETMDKILNMFDRHGRDRAGVALGLITKDERLKKWFTVQMEALPPNRPTKATEKNQSDVVAGTSMGQETFDVLIRSTAESGRFTRKDVEAICESDDTSRTRVIRTIHKAVQAWCPETQREILRVHTSSDPATNTWDGGVIRIQLTSRRSALKMLREFPSQLWGSQGQPLPSLRVVAASPNLAANDGREEEETVAWREVELEFVTNEVGLPDAESEVVVDSLVTAIQEVLEAEKLGETGQADLRLDGAVEDLFETMPSPGNAAFPTLKEWTDAPAVSEQAGSTMRALKERVKRINKEHSWSLAKRKQGAFAARGSQGGEKQYRTDLLFLALSKFSSLHSLSTAGLISEKNELVFTVARHQAGDANMIEEAGPVERQGDSEPPPREQR